MNIIPAKTSDSETVRAITHTTINAIYPRYYPSGAVAFFLGHHSVENISADISAGRVYLLLDDGQNAAGTVTIRDNEICRLFVLPQHQGKGYGKELINFAEKEIAKNYDEIVLDASFSAKAIYLKRGYREVDYRIIKTENGDHLCYDVMTKRADPVQPVRRTV